MCWTSIEKPIKRIAKEDIPVFKIGKITSYGDIKPYFYEFTSYLMGVTYKQRIRKYHFLRHFYIDKGLHSYSLSNIRLKPYYNVIKGIKTPYITIKTDKTTPESKNVIIRAQDYDISNIAIILCTIPKGSTYYVNSCGEVVSNKLTVNSFIKNPFFANKSNTTSATSVNRVNKLLDKWEQKFK